MPVDDLEQAFGADVGLRRLRIVLVHHRNFLAQFRDNIIEISDDLHFRLQAGQRRHHDAAGAGIHRNSAKRDEV